MADCHMPYFCFGKQGHKKVWNKVFIILGHFFYCTCLFDLLGPVVQSIIRLMSLLMTNSLTVAAKVFSNAMQKLLLFFFNKKYSCICQDRNFNLMSTLNKCFDREIRKISRKSMYRVHVCKHLITKPCIYNFDPLKPCFYIIKLRFTGVYIIFLVSA